MDVAATVARLGETESEAPTVQTATAGVAATAEATPATAANTGGVAFAMSSSRVIEAGSFA